MDVVQLVKEGKCSYEWSEVISEYKGYKLHIKVFRDAMKFDDIPAMRWDFTPIANDDRKFNGVRLPASAYQLQQIADLLGCMLLTPKVIDLIWLQAELKFDAVTRVMGQIVANSNITDVHTEIEKNIEALGGDDGSKLVSCVGKYWCLFNGTDKNRYGKTTACNYGWFRHDAIYNAVTTGLKCWQGPGFRHNYSHFDPSQTIRLMHPIAKLIDTDGSEAHVDLREIAGLYHLAPLFNHSGRLTYLRQLGPAQLEPMDVKSPWDYTIMIRPQKKLLQKTLELMRIM